jgi:hypothetical protein
MLLAAYFGGMQIGDVDKSKVYDVPAAILVRMTLVERATAKACAVRYRIRYQVRQ